MLVLRMMVIRLGLTRVALLLLFSTSLLLPMIAAQPGTVLAAVLHSTPPPGIVLSLALHLFSTGGLENRFALCYLTMDMVLQLLKHIILSPHYCLELWTVGWETS